MTDVPRWRAQSVRDRSRIPRSTGDCTQHKRRSSRNEDESRWAKQKTKQNNNTKRGPRNRQNGSRKSQFSGRRASGNLRLSRTDDSDSSSAFEEFKARCVTFKGAKPKSFSDRNRESSSGEESAAPRSNKRIIRSSANGYRNAVTKKTNYRNRNNRNDRNGRNDRNDRNGRNFGNDRRNVGPRSRRFKQFTTRRQSTPTLPARQQTDESSSSSYSSSDSDGDLSASTTAKDDDDDMCAPRPVGTHDSDGDSESDSDNDKGSAFDWSDSGTLPGDMSWGDFAEDYEDQELDMSFLKPKKKKERKAQDEHSAKTTENESDSTSPLKCDPAKDTVVRIVEPRMSDEIVLIVEKGDTATTITGDSLISEDELELEKTINIMSTGEYECDRVEAEPLKDDKESGEWEKEGTDLVLKYGKQPKNVTKEAPAVVIIGNPKKTDHPSAIEDKPGHEKSTAIEDCVEEITNAQAEPAQRVVKGVCTKCDLPQQPTIDAPKETTKITTQAPTESIPEKVTPSSQGKLQQESVKKVNHKATVTEELADSQEESNSDLDELFVQTQYSTESDSGEEDVDDTDGTTETKTIGDHGYNIDSKGSYEKVGIGLFVFLLLVLVYVIFGHEEVVMANDETDVTDYVVMTETSVHRF